MKKNVTYELKDFTWTQEDFEFSPKDDVHSKKMMGKRKEKKHNANKQYCWDGLDRSFFRSIRSKLKNEALMDDFSSEEEDLYEE